MWWPFQWLFIYVLGGFTCVPVIIALTIWYVMTYGSVPIGDDDPMKWVKHHRQRQHDAAAADTSSTKESTADTTKRIFAGYLTVRRQFRPAATGASFLFGSSTDLSGAEVKEEETDETASLKDGKSSSSPSIPVVPTVSQRLVGAYKQVRKTQAAPPKELFYCVLKGSVLFLYDDDKQAECVAAISIEKYHVGMEKREWADGRETGRSLPFDGKDGEMFAKRNACVMRLVEKETAKEKKGLPVVTKSMGDVDGNPTVKEREHQEEMENAPWFFFSTRNTEMEDLYIALVQVSAAKPTITDVFSFEGMKQLVNTIDTEPDPLSTRWLNAFVGRVFLSLNQTRPIENKIIDKIKLKLTKVQRPAWLGEIIINEVHVGKTPPIFYRPMLKDLTPTGGAAMEIGLKYRTDPLDLDSGVRFIASTQAIIPLGYKQVTVNIMVEARLKTLEGNVLLKIKEPPTNRIWWGFTSQPKLDVEIRPVVQDRKLNLSVVLNQLDSLLRKVIAESIVLPAMDDIAFFDTTGQDVRGGIFSSASKYRSASEIQPEEPTADDAVKAPEQIITSNEDPASATPETTGPGQRVPSKAKTLGPGLESLAKEEAVKTISRVDTAPAEIGAATAPKRTSGFEKWFPPVPGLVPSLTGEKDASSSSTAPLAVRDKGINGSAVEPRRASMSAGPKLVIPDSNPSSSSGARTPSPPHLIETPISMRSLPGTSGSIDTGSNPSINSIAPSSNLTASSPSSTTTTASASSSATLLSAVKQYRAGDKKALQDITKTGMDGVKKGWMSFAAKRKALVSGEPPSPEQKPANPVPYRPAEDDRDAAAGIAVGRTSMSGDGLSRSMEGKSLKERLDAAAHLNAAASTSATAGTSASMTTVTGRPRSGTESSKSSLSAKPSLLSSPSKSSVPTLSPTSAPHANWTPVSRTGDADHPAADPVRRGSSGSITSVKGKTQVQPVLTQPGVGKGMVVPRVPKRPGEVTGLGSSPGQGMVRKVSEGKEILRDAIPLDTGAAKGTGTSKLEDESSHVGDRSAGSEGFGREQADSASEEQIGDSDRPSLTSHPESKTSGSPSRGDLATAIENDQRIPALSDTPSCLSKKENAKVGSRPGSIRHQDRQGDLASAIEAEQALPPAHNSTAVLGDTAQASKMPPVHSHIPNEPISSAHTIPMPSAQTSSEPNNDLTSAIEADTSVPHVVDLRSDAGKGQDLARAIAADSATPPVHPSDLPKLTKEASTRSTESLVADIAVPPLPPRRPASTGSDRRIDQDGKEDAEGKSGPMTPRSEAEDALRKLSEKGGMART